MTTRTQDSNSGPKKSEEILGRPPLKETSHYNAPTINGLQFRTLRRVSSTSMKSRETIGILVLSISFACVSVNGDASLPRSCSTTHSLRTGRHTVRVTDTKPTPVHTWPCITGAWDPMARRRDQGVQKGN
ncbi:hypothetical protein BU25DRAFT_271095 [Macroventuria anomochaeta]|uniref:Uncharacterized protein n=1 Tax=Macroventuria anomochaeta TaxID=301207 RepID=A0ACB6S8G5_9PLEO|nr:uncharacterized protein BU25DRAFT_271095 [Macroventuria anomochaeta]KAF2629639.1 hypothetical protein BU25DRAFT_271095 [Macroventuria anomochaeta]